MKGYCLVLNLADSMSKILMKSWNLTTMEDHWLWLHFVAVAYLLILALFCQGSLSHSASFQPTFTSSSCTGAGPHSVHIRSPVSSFPMKEQLARALLTSSVARHSGPYQMRMYSLTAL